jgi:pimeloyl-ACP methyl ester carboxylesterase
MTRKKLAGTTPLFLGPDGRPLPHSVAEAQYLNLGGVDQWVMTRGAKTQSNPILILLHGGPGISETIFWRYSNSLVLEQEFTVVYWDQRGSGKSYDPNPSKETMTVEQFIQDLDELVDTLLRRFDKQKVVIFGHSWGSVLGALYCSKFANKVQCYVGCAQIGDWAASEKETYQFVLEEMEQRFHRRALCELHQVGPPPHDWDGLYTQRKWLSELEGDMSRWNGLRILYMHLKVPEASLTELFRFWKVLHFSIDAMWSEVSTINLVKQVPQLEMPTYFLLGRLDHCISPQNSMEFVDTLKAPRKEVYWFEDSHHLPFMDEPDRFNSIMTSVIRPNLKSD